jgi:hypothetical protein
MITVSENEFDKCNNCGKKTNGIKDFKNPKTGRINKTCSICREKVLKSVTSKIREVKRNMTLREQNNYMKKILKDQDKSFLSKLEKKYEYLPTILSVNDFNFQKIEENDNNISDNKDNKDIPIKIDTNEKDESNNDIKNDCIVKKKHRISQKELNEIKTKYPNLIIQLKQRGRPKKINTSNEDN